MEHLFNGTATLKMELPASKVGDQYTIEIMITDNSRIDPFVNNFEGTVIPFVSREGHESSRRKPPSNEKGDDRLAPSGLSLPHVEWVQREEWESHDFDKSSALKVVRSDEGADASHRSFDFFINAENIYLQKELERAKGTEDLLRDQFKIGLVLVGLALIYEAGDAADGQEIAERVAYSTRAMAMMLIPMINFLGDLDPKDLKAELVV